MKILQIYFISNLLYLLPLDTVLAQWFEMSWVKLSMSSEVIFLILYWTQHRDISGHQLQICSFGIVGLMPSAFIEEWLPLLCHTLVWLSDSITAIWKLVLKMATHRPLIISKYVFLLRKFNICNYLLILALDLPMPLCRHLTNPLCRHLSKKNDLVVVWKLHCSFKLRSCRKLWYWKHPYSH